MNLSDKQIQQARQLRAEQRELLRDLRREITVAAGELNGIEDTIIRIQKKLLEINKISAERLNSEGSHT